MTAGLVLRDFLATAFIIAAGAKGADVQGFSKTLTALGLYRLGSRLRYLVAATFILAEGVLGIATASAMWTRLVDVANLAITAGFVVVTGTALIRGASTKCRCYGALSGTVFTLPGLLRSLFLFAVAVGAVVLGYPGEALSTQTLFVLAAYVLLAVAAAQASTALQAIPQTEHAG